MCRKYVSKLFETSFYTIAKYKIETLISLKRLVLSNTYQAAILSHSCFCNFTKIHCSFFQKSLLHFHFKNIKTDVLLHDLLYCFVNKFAFIPYVKASLFHLSHTIKDNKKSYG